MLYDLEVFSFEGLRAAGRAGRPLREAQAWRRMEISTAPEDTLPVNFDNVRVFSPVSAQIREEIAAVWTSVPRSGPSILDLEGWCLAGRNGFLFHPESGIAIIGQGLGGSPDYVRWHTEGALGAVWSSDGRRLRFEGPAPVRAGALEEWSCLLGMPGQDIYGHWLLDAVPRMHLASEFFEAAIGARAGMLTPFSPPWAHEFFEVMGYPPPRVTTLEENKVYRLVSTLTPSIPKNGYVVHMQTCRDAWQAFRAASPRKASGLRGERLYVSRRNWAVQRPIANEEAVEAALTARGFLTVHPQSLSLAEQAELFAQARLIIGQDGSALHNILHAEPGAGLGVIGLPERRNYWHFAFTEAMGHQVAFMECLPGPGGMTADIAELNLMVDALEAVR